MKTLKTSSVHRAALARRTATKYYNRYKAQRKRKNDKVSISSNDTCAIMDKYMDGDILGMKAMTITQQSISEPFRKKKLPPQQTIFEENSQCSIQRPAQVIECHHSKSYGSHNQHRYPSNTYSASRLPYQLQKC